MRIQEPGFITPEILFLGSRGICMYLVMGEQYALLGGGVAWCIETLEAQLDLYRIDRDRIRYLVISHAHHDHCGTLPYLAQYYPHIQTVASEVCAQILNNSKAVGLMREVNRKVLDSKEKPYSFNGISLDFHPISVELQVGDGDLLNLGNGLSLQFFQTPGHSRCSLSVYIPELEALFPADAVPFSEEESGKLTVTANNNYMDYILSLEKLEKLPIRNICYEHGGVLTGDDADKIISRGLAATRQQMERIQKRYEELENLDLLVDEFAHKYQSLELFRLVPFDTMRAMMGKMVKSALGLL